MSILQKNRGILKSAIEKFNGEFVKEIGDGTLSIFQSSLDAVSCAVEIQETVKQISEWQLRIGIHTGDIMISEGDVFGDGVNISSRIQMLCDPGSIFISDRVYEDMRNKSDLSAKNLGEKRLKNIDQPVQLYCIDATDSADACTPPSRENKLGRFIRSRKAWIIGFGLMFTVIAALVLVFYPLLMKANEKVTVPIAVVSFENQTGDAGLDYLQKAIPNLIITNLEQSQQVRTMTWERMQDVLLREGKKDVGFIDFGLGAEICKKENFPFIVVGSIVKAGDVFMTDAKVLNVDTRQIITSVSAKGNGLASILETQIDELSRAIIKSVGLSGHKYEEGGIRIQDVTTNSMEAYDLFLKGREAFDKMYFNEARPYLEKAVRIDPGFAIAHLYLSHTYSSLGIRPQQTEELEKAFLTSSRATENERLTIQAAYAGIIQQNPLLQLSLLLQLAEKAPKEKRVSYALGLWYRDNGNPDKAIEQFRKAIELDPNYGEAINQLAYRYFYKGEYAAALECLAKYAELNPNDANPFDSMGDLFWQMGDLDRSLENFRRALDVKPDFYMSASKITYIYAIREDYGQVRYWMQKTMEVTPSNQMRAVMLWCTVFYDYLSGRQERAFKTLEEFSRIKGDPTHLVEMAYNWLMANISYDRGNYAEAMRFNGMYLHYAIAEPGDTPRQDSSGYYFIKGLCQVRQNKMDSAVISGDRIGRFSNDPANDYNLQYLQREIRIAEACSAEDLEKLPALPVQNLTFSVPDILIMNIPFTRNSLAEAYVRFNRPQKAIAEYERMISFDSTATDRYLVNPRYHYFLGILYENNQMKDKAAEQYQKFLNVCEGADPGLPELSDAKKRLAGLSGGR